MKKILFLILLSSPIYGADNYQAIAPFGGINNSDSPIVIDPKNAQDLLNVDVTPGGKSIKKREGYALFSSLQITTSPVHGVYNFYDSAGNSVDIYFNDTRMTSSVGGATPSVIFSTGSLAATYQCIDSQGYAYCANTGRTSLIKTNGQTCTTITTVNSTGTMVAVTPERLVTSGFAEAPNRIDLSKANDFSNWVIGSAATDAAQFTIVSPGSRITHIVYAFGRIIWFKDSSFGFLYIGQEDAQADWQIKTVDPQIGTLDNTSVYREGLLYFRAQDGHIYAYDGSSLTKLTRDLEATIQLSGNRTTNSWTQTTQTDFETSSITPSGYLSTTISAGNIVLGTATAISAFTDDSASDFGAASLVVDLDTTTLPGSAFIKTIKNTGDTGSSVPGDDVLCGFPYYQNFLASTTMSLNRIDFFGTRIGSVGTAGIYILSDNSLKPGTTLYSYTADFSATSTTGSWVVTSSTGSASITSGTRYWIGVIPSWTACSPGIQVSNCSTGAGGCTNNGNFQWIPPPAGSGNSNAEIAYRLFGSTGTGYLISRTFDNGFSTNTWLWDWSTFYASGTIPSSGSITYKTQTSSDSSCSTCWEPVIFVSSGASPTSTVKRYFRYVSSFTTTDFSTSPVLNYVEQNMTSRLRPGGTYYSQVHSVGTSINNWDTFSVNKQDNGGTQTFYIRGSSTAIGVNSSTPAWVSIGAGATPSISTYPYVQVKEIFSATKSTQSPTLNDFTVSWFEGTASDKSYGTYFSDAIWFSIPVGVSVSSNTRILRLDLLNQDWYIYDIGTNGMLVRNNSLYFGSSSLGKIYRFGDVDSDDGNAINAFWKSKDYVVGDPFVDKDFKSISVSAGSVSNSTVTVTYQLNGSSTTSFNFPLYSGLDYYKQYNKNLPLGTIGKTFSIKFGNNGADQPFEIFAGQFGYVPKTWIPSR